MGVVVSGYRLVWDAEQVGFSCSGLGHLVKAGEGGAECPDGRVGMDDLMWWPSGGRSVERERVYMGRSIAGRWSAERDLW